MKAGVALMLALAVGEGAAVRAQQNGVRQEDAVRLYLDCQGGCDSSYLRQEITFVSYVRDRADAQVHLLITTQGTGGGGRHYVLNFIGTHEFTGRSDTLAFSTTQGDSDDMVRQGLARTIKMGLMRFVSGSPVAPGIRITYEPPEGAPVPATGPRRDPWNYWVFRINANGNGNGEKARSNYSLNGSFTANRTTEHWKFNARVNGRYSESRITLSDSSEFINDTRDYSGNALLVKSLGAHFSAGLQANANSSIFSNEKIALRLAPAAEFNVFPYSESTRRALVVLYTVGLRRVDYHEETIYLKEQETLANESLEISYSVRQPWGDAGISVSGSHYFHDTGFYRLQFGGDTDIRLLRGLSLSLGCDYSRINDQLSLRRRDATDEELLVQRQQLATNYRYSARIGLSYSFGSIFNNVVNPRLDF